jgi:hypothetical protein
VRGGVRAVILRTALTKEPRLLFDVTLFTTQCHQTSRQSKVALSLHLAKIATSYSVQRRCVFVKAFSDARWRKISEGAKGV